VPYFIPSVVVKEKNALFTDGAWIILLYVKLTQGVVFRYCINNEPVTWQGDVYEPMLCQLGDCAEDGKITSTQLKVANVGGVLHGYIEDHKGATDGEVSIHVITTNYLEEDTSELDVYYSIMNAYSEGEWVVLNLGAPSPLRRAFPQDRYFADACPFAAYFGKGFECGYIGTDFVSCAGTYEDCEERDAAEWFGGDPALDPSGWRIA